MALRVTPEEYTILRARTGKAPSDITQPVTPKPSKYKNVKVTVDGETFDSKGEYARWCELCTMSKVGLIVNLRHKVKFPIEVKGEKICVYIADFVYFERGVCVVEDFKGIITGEYALKKKLLKAVWGLEIKEVRRRQK